ncbi:uncharacterized protein [Argopecten irradians]|uniref:uncharacterized protein n=1 Tax=Argopecten irradians TaxID=31199 RepID=UPI0037177ECE
MDRDSAFRKEICHKGQHIPLDPPVVHMSAYTKGGLHRLFRQIAHPDKVSFPIYEYGQFTNDDGQFCPVLGVVMASRYRVRQVISRRGQSAILLLAEDMFCHKKHVVVKVLHASRYQLGAQETHCLWRLALADPWGNSNTVHYLNTFTFDDHYCIVFRPLVPLSLTDIFHDIPALKVIPSIRKIAVRLLSTLGFLRQQNVIHADLKPENILLRDRNDLSSVTVIDFGNAIQHVHKEIALYYDDFELQTPLYRAPEVMFGMPFGKEIDMWSLGCILAELYLSNPLFMGNSKMDIMKQITSLLGPFPGITFQRGKFYSRFKHLTDSVEQPDATELLISHLGCNDYLFTDFLAGLLRYNPDERMTPFDAAKHSFLAPEFPFGYLLPPSSGDGNASYSAVHLNSTKYTHRPTVAADIRRSQPSTYDLLSLGTALKEEENKDESFSEAGGTPNKHGKVAKVVPVQRERSQGKGSRSSGEVIQYHSNERNLVARETSRKGSSQVQKVKRENVHQKSSSNSIQESAPRDNRRETRDQQGYNHQGETTSSTDIGRRRETLQRHSLAKKRERNREETSAGHLTLDNHYYSHLQQENLATGRYEAKEDIYAGSPNHRTERTGETTNYRNINERRNFRSAGDQKQVERRNALDLSPATEQQSLTGVSNVWENQVMTNITHHNSTAEKSQLTREAECHRGREITQNNNIDQTCIRNFDYDRKSSKYHCDKDSGSDYEDRRFSGSQCAFKDMNETFVIDSDNSSQSKTEVVGKKNEIIRPRPGWFSKKQQGESAFKHNDNTPKEHTTARHSFHQKHTVVPVVSDTQGNLNREIKHAPNCMTDDHTDSYTPHHIKRTQRLDIHGKTKHNFHHQNSGSTGKDLLHIPQSTSSLSQESLSDYHSGSNRPSPYKHHHQESPGQQTSNTEQLALLMKSIKEQQDLVEQDLSEKELERHFKFEVDHRTSVDQRDWSDSKVKHSKRRTSEMYESISDDDRKPVCDTRESACGAVVRPTAQFPKCVNAQKSEDNHSSFTSSNTKVEEEKHFKTNEFSKNRTSHWKKKQQSSPVLVSPSRSNSVYNEGNSEDCHRPAIKRSSDTTQRSSSQVPNMSIREQKHLKTKHESGRTCRSGVNDTDLCKRSSHEASNKIFTLDQTDNKEMVTHQNPSRVDMETERSKVRNKTLHKISYKYTDDLSDQDITSNECFVPAPQKYISESENEYYSRSSTDSAAVKRSIRNGSQTIQANDNTTTDSYMTSKAQESETLKSDSGRQIFSSKVKVKKMARKKLSFTDALKPRKSNQTKIKKLPKKRVASVSYKKNHGNNSKADPYDFTITPDKTKPYHSKENSTENSFGQAYSSKASDRAREGSKISSKISTEENAYQDLARQARRHETREFSQIDSAESIKRDLIMQQGKCPRKRACSQTNMKEKSFRNMDNHSRKFEKGRWSNDSGEEESSHYCDREKPVKVPKPTLSNDNQNKRMKTKEEKESQQLHRKSGDPQYYKNEYQPAAETKEDIPAKIQQTVVRGNKMKQKHKRKAVNSPRTGMKRQKQSDHWDSDCTGGVASETLSGTLSRSSRKTQNASERLCNKGMDKLDQLSIEKSKVVLNSEDDMQNCVQSEIMKSKRHQNRQSKEKEYESHRSMYEENKERESWQHKPNKKYCAESGDDHEAVKAGHMANSNHQCHKSPARRSHQNGFTCVAQSDSVEGKTLPKRCNMVAIGKSKRMTHIESDVIDLQQGKMSSPKKSRRAEADDIIQQYNLGRLDHSHTVVPRKVIPGQNEMYQDYTLEGSTDDMCTSDSEEVMLV